MSKALWKGWAVRMQFAHNKTPYSLPETCATRRRASIKQYNEYMGREGEYARDKELGVVQCVRVQLVEVEQ